MKLLIQTIFLTVLFCIFSTSLYAQVKETENKTNDKAIVYFYSLATTTTLGQIRKPVFLDDKEIADIRPERFFIIMLESGKHNFRLKNKKFGGIEMNFEAGKTYYIKIGWEADATLKPSGVFLISAESGAFDIKQLRPIDKGNIRDKNIVFTELK
ncbi:MAG TPA: DUF2846 domain-containing protein [Pyrinomonadaceae bacterium]|jgi:hypothetical protein